MLRFRPWVLVVLVLILGAVARAEQFSDRAALQALVRSADAVALSRCDRGVSSWSGDPPIIVTRQQCRVVRAFKGQPAEQISVQTLGGQVGDVSMSASAGAAIAPDTDAVLLLRRSEFGAYYVVNGGAAGALSVAGGYTAPTVDGRSFDDFARWVEEVGTP
ncbi:MAG: hypothetical protein HYR72_09595 [Deltaproteobacteria bacterium]|nr:hypothetical protein [Deltaproteobacteria bacterium]MBI3387951.1 hypothetical protein [Deltaproteobacteria bacterium]